MANPTPAIWFHFKRLHSFPLPQHPATTSTVKLYTPQNVIYWRRGDMSTNEHAMAPCGKTIPFDPSHHHAPHIHYRSSDHFVKQIFSTASCSHTSKTTPAPNSPQARPAPWHSHRLCSPLDIPGSRSGPLQQPSWPLFGHWPV